jgi:hypothetical protein
MRKPFKIAVLIGLSLLGLVVFGLIFGVISIDHGAIVSY